MNPAVPVSIAVAVSTAVTMSTDVAVSECVDTTVVVVAVLWSWL